VAITRERAERIARAHPCERCGEYSYKKVSVKPAAANTELGETWQALLVCGVCDRHQELGIDDEGEIVYVS
jgi:transcription elongation factor Elf1